MFLDGFRLDRLIFQVKYKHALALWDRAGALGSQILDIWPGIELHTGNPQAQSFKMLDVHVEHALTAGTVTLWNLPSIDQRKTVQLKNTLDAWKTELKLEEAQQVSLRILYAKDFESLKEANGYLVGLNLTAWPTEKVFGQPQDSDRNGPEISFRFEDPSSFAVLRIKAEQVTYDLKLDHSYIDTSSVNKRVQNRVAVDFDRGSLKVKLADFRFEDWLKGCLHVLRRDIDKVVKVRAR